MQSQRSPGVKPRLRKAALCVFVASISTAVVGGEPAEIPAPLEPWVDWVLEGRDERACALDDAGGGDRLCAWPGRLRLDLDHQGGVFEQSWTLQAERWVPLPGGVGQWPQQVSGGDEPLAVVERAGWPAVQLPPGEHRISGRFAWPRPPNVLKLPPEIALISLRLDGEPVTSLRFDQRRGDERGGLWLGGQPSRAQTDEPERLSLEVARRVEDRLPLRVQTRLLLEVAGAPREVLLGPVLLPGAIPLRLESPLPARLLRPRGDVEHTDEHTDEYADERGAESDHAPGGTAGRPALLQVQVRPGRWVLSIEAQHPGLVDALTLPESIRVEDAIWPDQEVWAFAAEPGLRQVALSGGQPIDPHQARIPDDWRQLPTLLMQPGQSLRLKTLRRGAAGRDRVRLQRVLRLDFDGGGFSVRDRLQGELETGSRLEAEPTLKLGQVRVDGEPRLITRLPGTDRLEGVEVRPGALAMSVDARLETGRIALPQSLPASGWTFPLAEVSSELLLPPGWDLLAADGVDNLPDSWIGRWTLLDLFLVLVAALAVGRLWGAGWGLLALLTLVLTWQEPGAPRWVWLHLILAAALLRALRAPANEDESARDGQRVPHWLARLVRLYFGLALLGLALIAVPFLVTEMRDGLFPQLEHQGAGLVGLMAQREPGHGPRPRMAADVAQPVRSDPSSLLAMEEAAMAPAERSTDVGAAGHSAPKRSSISPSPAPKAQPIIDPSARLQTGPGVPDWTWHRFQLGWSGPLPAGQPLELWLMPPWATRLLALLTLLLVPMLALRLIGWRPHRLAQAQGSAVGLIGLSVTAWLVLHPGAAQAAADAEGPLHGGFPPPALLKDLEQRLLEPAACVPRCAEIARMQLDLAEEQLRLVLVVDAAAAVALPVPADRQGWMPTVIQLNGEPWQRLRWVSGGRFVVPVPSGRHLLQLSGPVRVADPLVLPLPLRPRLVEARLGPGWRLEGMKANGVPSEQLQLTRRAAPEPASGAAEEARAETAEVSERFPPLLRITRTLRFGLDWQVETEVRRLSPADGPVSLWLPLIEGEAVNSGNVSVNAAGALIALGSRQRTRVWRSTLEPVDRLSLIASKDVRLSEEWRLEVSPFWHLEAAGFPAVQPGRAKAEGLAIYRPLPGEQLQLRLSRPVGVVGEQKTLDQSLYQLTPGRRTTEARLELQLRSTEGGRYRLALPDAAELMWLRIDGRAQPLTLQAQTLELPLVPGAQRIEIGWREPHGLGARYQPSQLGLGIAGVNAETQVRLPADRWVLWTAGPGIGPAVQFWALLLALAVLAWLLARARLTPLGFWDWLLLSIGLSQVSVWVGALVVLWLFALGWRQRLTADLAPWRFNLVQVSLVLLSLAALIALLAALEQGLLGSPAMQIAGNGSTAEHLRWYLDRQSGETAAVTVISAPIWVYRLLMLAWALWLAWRLLGWLRWGWANLMSPVPWRRSRRQQFRRKAADQGLSVDI